MSDEQGMENEIKAKGLTAPRVTFDAIEALMKGVTYHTSQPEGTTSTIVTAFDVNGFSLCTKIMACASPENFDAELGVKYGVEKCAASARDMLWKLEGYRLKCHLAEVGAL
jgi:hypothetical protein